MHPWVAEAMVVGEFMRQAGVSVAQADAWAARLSGQQPADGRWLAYPIKVEHMPPSSEGAVAIVVTSAASEVRVQGLAWGADPASPTCRVGPLGSLPDIAARAYAEAGISDVTGIPVETTDRSVVRGLMSAVGLGLVGIDSVADVLDSSQPPILNGSGGLWQSNPVFAAGLECVARAAEYVRGGAQYAVGHSSYGYAGQGNLVAVLGRS
jgi:hypothetical protein